MFGSFTEEALLAYAEQIEKKYREKAVTGGQGCEIHDNYGTGQNDKSFIEEDESQSKEDYSGKTGKVKTVLRQKGVVDHSEWSEYDFTVCVRDNGTVYGTRGKCRLGKETSEDQAALLRASNRKRRRGTLGGSLKQRVARDPEANHLAKQLKDLDGERTKARKRLSDAATNLERNRGQEEARAKYRKAQAEANQVLTKHERVRSALNRRVRDLALEQRSQNQAPQRKATKDVPDWATEGKRLG